MVGNPEATSQPRGHVRLRWATALLAIAWAAVALLRPQRVPTDAAVLWTATRAALHGKDPYQAVTALGLGYPLYYPLPTVLLLAPLAVLPAAVFHGVFAGLSGFAFGCAAEKYRRGLAMGCLSAGFAEAAVEGQWSPLFTAAAVLPILGGLWIAKPSVGLAMFAGFPSRQAVVGGALLLLASLAIWPSWVPAWLAALQRTNHVPPLLRPGGVLLLLALRRWRKPEGRLLAALACVPQTTVLYETVPLFLIPRTRFEGYLLAGLSLLAAFVQATLVPARSDGQLAETIAGRWPVLLALVYIPALIMVLRAPTEVPAPLARDVADSA